MIYKTLGCSVSEDDYNRVVAAVSWLNTATPKPTMTLSKFTLRCIQFYLKEQLEPAMEEEKRHLKVKEQL